MNAALQRCHLDHTGGEGGVKSQFWWSIKMRFWRKANPWKSKYGRKAFMINYRSSGQSLEGMIAAFLSSTFPLFLCCDIIFLGPFFFLLSSPSLRDSEAQMHAIIKSAPHCLSTFREPEHSSLLGWMCVLSATMTGDGNGINYRACSFSQVRA